MAKKLLSHGADVGICLDGDADRVMIIDEKGQVADGDQIMALFAARWGSDQRLSGNTLVATVMSNLGLERYLAARDIALHILPGYNDFPEIAARLGPHKRGKSCWYIKSLDQIDDAALRDLIRAGLDDLAAQYETIGT